MTNSEKKQIYNDIIQDVARIVKRRLNEDDNSKTMSFQFDKNLFNNKPDNKNNDNNKSQNSASPGEAAMGSFIINCTNYVVDLLKNGKTNLGQILCKYLDELTKNQENAQKWLKVLIQSIKKETKS